MTASTESMATPMVKAEGVCKNFGALKVLKGVTLEIGRGQVLVLVGPSGSGKSTFLRCINHLEQVNAGRLYVDGDLIGYREKGGKLYEMQPREAARQNRKSARSGNGGGAPNYWPNSFGGPAPDAKYAEPPVPLTGVIDRFGYELTDDDFVQPGALFREVMSDTDRAHLIGNLVAHMKNAQVRIQKRQTALFYKADKAYGEGVAKGLGLDVAEIAKLAAMTQEERVKATEK